MSQHLIGRTLSALAIVAVATSAGAVVTDHADGARMPRPHVACPTEDSSWCVWDARHNGDGVGRSFWTDKRGNVHYVSHTRAHAMVTR